MGRKTIIVVWLVGLALWSIPFADAQQTKRVSRIGILAGQSSSVASSRVVAFRKGLIELGYTEGKNIAIESRYADGRSNDYPIWRRR